MPAVSGKQYRFMAARMKGDIPGVGPSPEVAREFVEKTSPEKRKLFARKDKKKNPFK